MPAKKSAHLPPHHYPHLPISKVMWRGFLAGIASGVGSVLGATVIISFLLWILSRLDFIPFIHQILDELSLQIANR